MLFIIRFIVLTTKTAYLYAIIKQLTDENLELICVTYFMYSDIGVTWAFFLGGGKF